MKLSSSQPSSSATIAAGHRAMVLEQNPGVILLTAAECAADGVEPEQFRCLNGLR